MRFENQRNCVYSLCAIGDSCVFVGDGVGMMFCYDVLSGSERSALKYGIQASSSGAVRCIVPVGNGSVAAAGEDGKILIFSY